MSITELEIRQVVAAVLDAENVRHAANLDDVVLKAVATILTSFGIEEEDRIELRADFQHLRKWRKSVEQAQSITMRVAVTVIVTGTLGAIWLGVKTLLSVKS
ncbi:hypothetical protein ACWAT4_21390 [Bradyrhizobium manausense]